MSLRVVDAQTRAVLPGIPTPRLCDEASRAFSVEAYRVDAPSIKSGAVWYARLDDEGFKSPTGEYVKVRIEQTEDYRVDVRIKPIGPDERDEEETYEDYFIVEAAGEQEAMRLAEAAATTDVEDRFGDEYGSLVTTIRAQRGVSI